MKRIYVAGPYSADNVMDVLRNIRNGIDMSYEVFVRGYAPFCPWLDYQYVLMDLDGELTLDDFYNYSIAWLAVSDGILVLEGWETSKGTLAEIEYAKLHHIPIFYDIYDICLND